MPNVHLPSVTRMSLLPCVPCVPDLQSAGVVDAGVVLPANCCCQDTAGLLQTTGCCVWSRSVISAAQLASSRVRCTAFSAGGQQVGAGVFEALADGWPAAYAACRGRLVAALVLVQFVYRVRAHCTLAHAFLTVELVSARACVRLI